LPAQMFRCGGPPREIIFAMSISYFPDGGFWGTNDGPTPDSPLDWYVWHFTHVDNLAAIAAAGCIRCDDAVGEHKNVADEDIKARRRRVVVNADGYPRGRAVSSHVPWYFAARSPMLYRLKALRSDLVFFGMRIGDAIDAGLEFCASDANAAAGIASFSTDVAGFGSFIDFDLMTQRDWYNTAEDMWRKSRRAAEFLVWQEVPLEVISAAVTYSASTMSVVRETLEQAGYGGINVSHRSSFYY